jgi:hypothetical protein
MQAIRGKRLLVLEDEYLIACEVAMSVADAGAIVIGPCANCAAAGTLLDAGSVDGAILDIDLRDGADVYPLADRLILLNKPFVFFSGISAQSVARRFTPIPFITKPCSPMAVLETLDTLFQNRPDAGEAQPSMRHRPRPGDVGPRTLFL